MTKRPQICFLGDEKRSRRIMNSFKGSINSFYIGRNHKNPEKYVYNKLSFICLVAEFNNPESKPMYPDAIEIYKKTDCPIYVVSTQLQFENISKAYKNKRMKRITVTELHKIIKNLTDELNVSGLTQFEAVVKNMETISIISSNPVLTAFSESKTISKDCNRRIIISPTINQEEPDDDRTIGYIVTESFDKKSDTSVKTAEKLSESGKPVFYVGTAERKHPPKGTIYVSVKTKKNKIADTLNKTEKLPKE